MTLGGISTTTSIAPILKSRTKVPFAYVDVYLGGVKQRRLSIIDGSFSEDESRDIQWECSITLVDPTNELIPKDMNDLLAPKGTELKMYMGFDDEEPTPCGVYVITNPDVDSTDVGATLTIKGNDSSVRITNAGWEVPFTPGSVTIDQAIIAGVDNRVTGIQKLFAPDANAVPPGKVWGADSSNNPWKDFKDLATATTKELRFDKNGVLVFLPRITDFNNPVEQYILGGGKLLKCKRSMNSGHPTYNTIIVTGASPSGGTVRVIVHDADTTSPTYYLGPYGRVSTKIDSSTITTSNQAENVGKQALADNLGLRHKVTLDVLRNPKISVGDVVVIGHAPTKTDGYFVVSSRSMNLLTGRMQLVCRERITP